MLSFEEFFRQVCNVSLPTFRVKLDTFHLSKLISFDAARRIPMLHQMSQGRVREALVQPMKLRTIKVAHSMQFDCSVFIASQTSILRSDSCESAGSISDQREGLGRTLRLRRHRWAIGQGRMRCFKSASLTHGSLPRAPESEATPFHEAYSLHPSKTVANMRWRGDLAAGRLSCILCC